MNKKMNKEIDFIRKLSIIIASIGLVLTTLLFIGQISSKNEIFSFLLIAYLGMLIAYFITKLIKN